MIWDILTFATFWASLVRGAQMWIGCKQMWNAKRRGTNVKSKPGGIPKATNGFHCRVRKRKNFQSGKIFDTIRLLCAINVNKCSISGLPRQFLTVSGLSRKFLYFLDSIWIWPASIWIVWKVSRLSRQSLDCSESFWIKRTLSGLSGKFICYPDSLWIVRTAFRLYGQSLDCLENWIIHFHSF